MSIAIDVTYKGMDAAIQFGNDLIHLPRHELLDVIGALVESQTKRRIISEKTTPDGDDWVDNSGENPIMHLSGGLHDDIAFQVESDAVYIGSSLPYAAQRHFGGIIKAKDADKLVFYVGGKKIAVEQVEQPAREYLGLSDENAIEIEQVTAEFIEVLLQ